MEKTKSVIKTYWEEELSPKISFGKQRLSMEDAFATIEENLSRVRSEKDLEYIQDFISLKLDAIGDEIDRRNKLASLSKNLLPEEKKIYFDQSAINQMAGKALLVIFALVAIGLGVLSFSGDTKIPCESNQEAPMAKKP